MLKKEFILSLLTVAILSVSVLAQDPVPIYKDNYKVLLENDKVRVVHFILRKGATEDFHSHPAAVTYVLTPFKIRFRFPDGTERIREAKAGDVFYGEAVIHSPLNIGDTDASGILVEMKPQPATAKRSAPADAELLTAVTFITGLEGKEEELKRELLALSAPTRAESGNITYDLYQSPQKKNEFLRFEVWRNPAALEEHKQTPHIKASFAKRQQQGWKTNITVWKRVAD
jgi:quinol monooxygenase YgiN